ncbi:MAG: hypothetical protein HQL76_04140 [Magnetococcales bacterium]|nr:hypothetical protein [Magnetococcales bacterium]
MLHIICKLWSHLHRIINERLSKEKNLVMPDGFQTENIPVQHVGHSGKDALLDFSWIKKMVAIRMKTEAGVIEIQMMIIENNKPQTFTFYSENHKGNISSLTGNREPV